GFRPMRSLCSGGAVRQVIRYRKRRLSFILTDDHVLLSLPPSQTFLLEPEYSPGSNLWVQRLEKVRQLIIDRKIRDLENLFIQAGPHIKLVPVKKDWYV